MASLSAIYRPQTFADITDQEPIKETLRREIETGKIGHAYLFGGPRGVGKTTTARIFAKALNCLNQKNGEPCNVCESCVQIQEGKALDVIEMDAASNTGVDNVREAIVEHVRYQPQRKHKVYILDEAHMLSTSAWNALLKTIEEPPAYAVFLFLTTELHKVPATIASRCQRFDFHRINDAALTERIQTIAEKEGLTIDADVVRSIVSKSDGCLRDAESLLGQLLVLGEKKITSEVASLVMPVSRLPIAAELLSVWSKRELGASLKAVGDLEEQGVPLLPLFDDLIQAVRQLLLASDSVEWRQTLSQGDEAERKLATLVSAYEPAELSEMALLIMERRRDAKQGADVRFCLELSASAISLGVLPHGPKGETHEIRSPKPPTSTTPSPEARFTEKLRQEVKESEKHPEPKSSSSTPPIAKTVIVEAPAPVKAAPASNISLTLGQVQARWPSFLQLMDERSKSITFVLKITQPAAVKGNVVTFRFQYPFHKEKVLTDTKTKHLVEDALAEALKVPSVLVEGIVEAEGEEARENRERDTVSSIMKAFGGSLVEGAGDAS